MKKKQPSKKKTIRAAQAATPKPQNGPRAAPSERASPRARFAENFSNIVAVLMRDPGLSKLRVADLEWLVLPALMSGQWRVAQATIQSRKPAAAGKAETNGASKDSGTVVVPAAVALWARVSPAVDARLSSELDKPIVLRAHEWNSGDILWLIAVAGDRRVLPRFLSSLFTDVFKDKPVKSRVLGEDGKPAVRVHAAAKA